MTYVPDRTRNLVAERANFLCEYCQSAELITSGPMHVEHIVPSQDGGSSEPTNLAYSCARCNLGKGKRTSAIDPVTDESFPIYNPRTEQWNHHFVWSDDKTRVVGLTPTGRVTIIACNMNQTAIVMSRSLWVSLGIHPPETD